MNLDFKKILILFLALCFVAYYLIKISKVHENLNHGKNTLPSPSKANIQNTIKSNQQFEAFDKKDKSVNLRDKNKTGDRVVNLQPVLPLAESKEQTELSSPAKKERDLFSERNLKLPMPTSLPDLLSNLTSFDDARLANGKIDGDFCTGYRGFFVDQDYMPRRIQLERTFSDSVTINLSIELAPEKMEQWTYPGELEMLNFNKDPYSQVIRLPNQGLIYLKFSENQLIPNYCIRPIRILRGWYFYKKTNSQMLEAPLVLAEYHLDLWCDDGLHEEERWPNYGDILSIFPRSISKIK